MDGRRKDGLKEANHCLHCQRSVNKDPRLLVALEPLARARAVHPIVQSRQWAHAIS